MGTFEPMSEDALQEIAGNCATETSVLARVVATALHHLARATVLTSERDASRRYVEHLADDCAPGLETAGNASLHWVLTRPEVQAALRLGALVDRDLASPGDDITHAAFDELDRGR